jgi:hypothetical protein
MAHASFSSIAATLIALFSVTAIAETPAPDASGIEGTIVVSPTRPGPIRKGEESSVAPVGNTQFVVKAGDAIVKTFKTDGEGRFRVTLPPGHYVVLREGAAPGIGRWWPGHQGELDCRQRDALNRNGSGFLELGRTKLFSTLFETNVLTLCS